MATSHTVSPKPTSSLLSLVCLLVLRRSRPEWVSLTAREAATREDVSPERLSRLATCCLADLQRVVDDHTRRGRPPMDRAHDLLKAELALTTELLAVATSLLEHQPQRVAAPARALVLGALERLRTTFPTFSIKRFAAALAIPERTLRAWRRSSSTAATATPAPTTARPHKTKRPPRRGRFNFDLLLPGTQFTGDTTDLEAFRVPLKLIATQDIGGRDQSLFDSVILDDHESAALVSDAITTALEGLTGAQFLTDQGTPYMAAATREVLENLGVEHAPQPEGEPTRKATIERAFRTLKSIAAPLFGLTNRLADRLPALREPELAKAATRLLVTALLRAYQAGARATAVAKGARASLDIATLTAAAESSREHARAEDQSARLLLDRLHRDYGMPGSQAAFRRALRGVALEVLRAAEKAFARQAHRDDIRDRKAYFARIVRELEDAHRTQRARQTANREQRARLDADLLESTEQQERWTRNPTEWLSAAIRLIASLWLPDRGVLAGDGHGPGAAYVRGAMKRLVELHGPRAAADTATAVATAFTVQNAEGLGDEGLAAVLKTFWAAATEVTTQAATPPEPHLIANRFRAAILPLTGPPRRPASHRVLRN